MYGVRTDLRDDRETQKAHVFAGAIYGVPPPIVIHQASIFIQNPAPLPCNLTLFNYGQDIIQEINLSGIVLLVLIA